MKYVHLSLVGFKLLCSLHVASVFSRLNYLLAGGLHPVGFHVLNIVLHAAVSALMIDVFAILTGGLARDEKRRMLNRAPKTSLLASLLFAAHPVHTESVSKWPEVFILPYDPLC